jgi:uncharacterized tellurite resistance protein B-like protein
MKRCIQLDIRLDMDPMQPKKMISIFKKLSNSRGVIDIAQADQGMRVPIATCAILMAVAGADEFTDEERQRIIGILKDEFNLGDEDAEALMEMAGKEIDKSIDYWRFTNTLNQNLSVPEKIKIMENVWKVVYADGQLSGHEDTLVHKFSFLLDLRHEQMISAKIKVKNELGLDRDVIE